VTPSAPGHRRPAAKLSGTIVTAEAKPVPGASIVVAEGGWPTARSREMIRLLRPDRLPLVSARWASRFALAGFKAARIGRVSQG